MRGLLQRGTGCAALAVGIALLGAQTVCAQEDTLSRLEADAAAHPWRLDLWMDLGNYAAADGKLDLALSSFQKVLAHLEPDSRGAGDLHLRIGEVYRRKGDLPAAVESLTRASQLLPDRPVVMGTLALVLDGIGRKPEAARAYRAAIALDPENATAINNLAYLLAEQGQDLDEAWRLAEEAVDLSDGDPEILDTAGWVQWKRKQIDSAVGLFAQALTKDTGNAEYRGHLVLALERRQDSAAGQARALLSDSPGNPEKTREALRVLTGK